MLNYIEVKPKTELSKILFAKKYDLSQKVNLLFGSNGVGKTTLIEAILGNKHKNEYAYDKNDKPTLMFSYSNSTQNKRHMTNNPYLKYQDYFNPDLINQMFTAKELSEGQSIIYTIQEFLYLAKTENDTNKDYLFLIDELDSGLSIDNIIWVCDKINKIIKDRENIQFIIAFNNYEFCNQFKTVTNMYTGKLEVIDSYDEYKNKLISNREKLLKKRKNNQFREEYNNDK